MKAIKTPENPPEPIDAEVFSANMQKIAERYREIVDIYFSHSPQPDSTLQDSLHIGQAFMHLFSRIMQNPAKIWEAQFAFWQDYVTLWHQSALSFTEGQPQQPVIAPDAKDKRFRDKAWQENVLFDFLKQSYLLSASHLQRTVREVEGLDAKTHQKIDFYTRQYVDALSPSNFLLTNPEVLRKTLETGGENLVNGLENVLEDLKRGDGQLRISMTGKDAFEVGKNLAVTPGAVVYQNELMQLIQYEPATKDVHKTPLLLMPAWINKFYVLDLKPENSLVKWAVESGYTVFVIAWVNPDERLARKGFEDYMLQGPLAALDAIEKITGEKSASVIGYCLGGTLLACTLAYLSATGQSSRVASAAFLTTMLDFSDAGELSVFIDEEQLQALEAKMQRQGGVLEGSEMSNTFNMLRANDLIWSFVVNNYLLGKDPFPFDLLFWNADATRMPAVMHSFYLRNMYQNNLLAKKNGISLNGKPIDLSAIKTPSYFLSTREDHIAPWKSTYAATRLFSGPLRFVLAASGHVAGVINPPSKGKYGHSVVEAARNPSSPEEWLAQAQEKQGSWWLDWDRWQAAFSGGKVPARKIGGGVMKPIEPAPGSYVKVMAK